MDHVVDTVIIGGGPAGISCAIALQRDNVPNLVLEKRSFPRDKTCGGLVTNKTIRLLAENLNLPDTESLSPAFCDAGDLVELYHGGKLLTRSYVSKSIHFVKRIDFDKFLAAKYKELGGKLLESTGWTDIDMASRRIFLTNGDTVEFKHIVAADGALSDTGKLLGYKRKKLGFCIETHIPKSKLTCGDEIRVYFGPVKKGYAWVFPSGDELCIGLGGVYKKGIKYDLLLKEFLAFLGLDNDEYVFKGAFVPYGKTVRQSRGYDNALLIGDAGGFADPIYGEGLYFAVASGMEAANAIISKKPKARPEFIRRMAPFVKIIKQGNRLQNVFFSAGVLKLFKRIIFNKNAFVGFYCDNQISEYNYSYSKLFRLYRDYKKGSADDN